LKGLQKEVQVPHLGMSSSAIKNLKGENENFLKKLDKQSNTSTYIPEAEEDRILRSRFYSVIWLG